MSKNFIIFYTKKYFSYYIKYAFKNLESQCFNKTKRLHSILINQISFFDYFTMVITNLNV